MSILEIVKHLNSITRGWLNYYVFAFDDEFIINSLDGWMRRKIRTIIWKQWKRYRKRYLMLSKFSHGNKHKPLVHWMCRNGNRYWYISLKLNLFMTKEWVAKNTNFKELTNSILIIKESHRYMQLSKNRYS